MEGYLCKVYEERCSLSAIHNIQTEKHGSAVPGKEAMPRQSRDPQASGFKNIETMQNTDPWRIINRDDLRIR